MLIDLTLRDFVLIGAARLEFGPGLNLVTGETGSGKSLLVEALELLAGARLRQGLVRPGRPRAVLSLSVELPAGHAALDLLDEAGLDVEAHDGRVLVVLRRVLPRRGPSRCFIGDTQVTAGLLRRFAGPILHIQGQRGREVLLTPGRQMSLVDRAAGVSDEVAAIGDLYATSRTLRQRRSELRATARERQRRVEFLRYQVAEIDELAPEPGEIGRLEEEERRLAHGEELRRETAALQHELAEGEGAVADRLAAALRRLSHLVGLDSALAAPCEQLESARALIDDATLSLAAYRDRDDLFDPDRLDAVVDRLDRLRRLVRKYDVRDERELVALRHEMAREAAALDAEEHRADQLEDEIRRLDAEALELCRRVHDARLRGAAALGRAVEARLAALAMEAATFEVRLSDIPRGADAGEPPFGPRGTDEVAFLFSANPGQPLDRLERIASGGELSRILLALDLAIDDLAGHDEVPGPDRPTLFFDEIDAGLGGEAASALARELAQLGRRAQVLVITHQPQVAALEGRHFAVTKRIADEETETNIIQLDRAGRIEELARMVGGDHIDEVTRRQARSLLDLFARPQRPRKSDKTTHMA